ncbi:hypothetical protein [Streptomyces sp. NPDC058294]|uniref:hypothetical protein n=1 Tax=Streptomyces sp. NPDC058294 TaxID=3346430 RepID=UPI0036E78DC3
MCDQPGRLALRVRGEDTGEALTTWPDQQQALARLLDSRVLLGVPHSLLHRLLHLIPAGLGGFGVRGDGRLDGLA